MLNRRGCNASVNSSYAQPSPPSADSRALAFFLSWMANSRGWGRIKRANAPSSVSTATFLIDGTVE